MMEQVRIAVLDVGNHVVAFMDNTAPKAIHYYKDELHNYLQGTAYTFKFTVSAFHEDSEYLEVGNHLSFCYREKEYYMNIMSVEEDEFTVDVEAYGLVFELIGEEKESYKASKAMSFVEYMKIFDSPGAVKIGINEVASYTRTLEWTAAETMLARIYSLATNFDAEVEFVTVLNRNYSLKQITMNIYREHSDTVQGIGTDRSDEVLRYGKGINGIRKTSDITGLYTAIRPFGKNNLTISGLDKKEYDSDGNLEYQVSGSNILAVQAKDRFPAMITDYTTDRYVAKIWSYDTDNKNTLYSKALSKLKEICVPKVSYDAEGHTEKDIGDTVTIVDEEFHPPLYLKARITEQVISFTNSTNNKTTFDNFTELSSKVDASLMKQVQKMIEENKTYQLDIVSYYNADSVLTLKARLMDGIKEVTSNYEESCFIWYKMSGNTMIQVGTGYSYATESSKEIYRCVFDDGGEAS